MINTGLIDQPKHSKCRKVKIRNSRDFPYKSITTKLHDVKFIETHRDLDKIRIRGYDPENIMFDIYLPYRDREKFKEQMWIKGKFGWGYDDNRQRYYKNQSSRHTWEIFSIHIYRDNKPICKD